MKKLLAERLQIQEKDVKYLLLWWTILIVGFILLINLYRAVWIEHTEVTQPHDICGGTRTVQPSKSA